MDENKKKKLMSCMVRGELQYVIRAYEEYPDVRELKMRTGDTALHVAASDGWGFYAEKMVKFGADVLAIENAQGDTALHLAAKSGSAYFCKCIAQKDIKLLKKQNKSGETPLFSAVPHGNTQAFLYLYHLCSNDIRIAPQDQHEMYTKENGDTILHSAISGGHFDLAYIIILKCPELVHKPNNDGVLPLHLLATKPSAFPSGDPVFGIRKLFYHCVRVPKLPNLAKAPDPQLSWTEFSRPLRTNSPDLSSFEFLLLHLPIVIIFYLLKRKRRERARQEQQDGEAANIQVLDHQNNQEDEETANSQGYGEIDQEDEEAANEQVDHKENLQQDEPTTDKLEGLADIIGTTIGVLLALLVLPIMIVWVCVVVCIMCVFLCFMYVLLLLQGTLVLAKKIFGYEELLRLKRKCVWSEKVMTKLIESYEKSLEASAAVKIVENPIFEAAKNGIWEMVLLILDQKADAIHDVNAEEKNIVMLAVEHRQYHLYDVLINQKRISKIVFEHVDKGKNNLLHIAANLKAGKQFWRIRGAALHMQMEIKGYRFIKRSMPRHLVDGHNKNNETPKMILQDSHGDLIKEGRQWLTDTSQSCSLVAALIATVAFATSATVPGGLKQDSTGVPSLEHKTIFIVSAISSLVALSSSMVSVVMFLGILTSSFKLKDFRTDLPYKLLWGLVSLLISIVSMIISFYAGHCFVLKQEFNHTALVYEILCSSLVVFIIYKFPLDFEIVWTTIRTRPTK